LWKWEWKREVVSYRHRISCGVERFALMAVLFGE